MFFDNCREFCLFDKVFSIPCGCCWCSFCYISFRWNIQKNVLLVCRWSVFDTVRPLAGGWPRKEMLFIELFADDSIQSIAYQEVEFNTNPIFSFVWRINRSFIRSFQLDSPFDYQKLTGISSWRTNTHITTWHVKYYLSISFWFKFRVENKKRQRKPSSKPNIPNTDRTSHIAHIQNIRAICLHKFHK